MKAKPRPKQAKQLSDSDLRHSVSAAIPLTPRRAEMWSREASRPVISSRVPPPGLPQEKARNTDEAGCEEVYSPPHPLRANGRVAQGHGHHPPPAAALFASRRIVQRTTTASAKRNADSGKNDC